MGNSNKKIHNDIVLQSIYSNDDTKFAENTGILIKANNAYYIKTDWERTNTKKVGAIPRNISIEVSAINNDSHNILKYMIDNKFVDITNYCNSDFVFNNFKRRKITKMILQMCVDKKIVLSELLQTGNILNAISSTFSMKNNHMHASTYDLLVANYPKFVGKFILHDLLCDKSKRRELFINSFTFITYYKMLCEIHSDYKTLIDDNGNSLLMIIAEHIGSVGNVSSTILNNIITLLVNDGFSIHFENVHTKNTIKNMVLNKYDINPYVYSQIKMFNDLFTIFDIFQLAIKCAQISIDDLVSDGKYKKVFTDNKNTVMTIDINENAHCLDNNPFPKIPYTGTILHILLKFVIGQMSISSPSYKYQSLLRGINDITLTDSQGSTLLDIAVQCNYNNLIKNIPNVERIVNKNSTFSEQHSSYKFFDTDYKVTLSPLSFACEYRDVAMIQEILNIKDINLNFKNTNGTTVLQMIELSNNITKPKLCLVLNKIRTDNLIGKPFSSYYTEHTDSFPPDEGTSVYCKVCLENKINVLFYPCAHAACCNMCYGDLRNNLRQNANYVKCVLCNTNVSYVTNFII